eukprot:GDKI01048879.1.p1 GENE.GDKI01048879.1~~GDKI01048879.1.p1  ORF type:complete len:430 (+),score=137.02 GDKI01048879.1:110-1399(+)
MSHVPSATAGSDSTATLLFTAVIGVAAAIIAFVYIQKQKQEKESARRRSIEERQQQEREEEENAKKDKERKKGGKNLAAAAAIAASIEKSKQAKQVDKATHHPLYLNHLKGFNRQVTCVAVDNTGTKVAVVSEDRTLKVFFMKPEHFNPADPNSSKAPEYVSIQLSHDYASVVDFTNDGEQVVSIGATDRKMSVHTITKPMKQLFYSSEPLHKNTVRWMNAKQGKFVVTCSEDDDNDVKVLSYRGEVLASYNTKQIKNYQCSVSLFDARFVGVSAWSAGVKVMEISGKEGNFAKLTQAMHLKSHCGINAVAFAPNNEKAVFFQKDGVMALWNINVRYQVSEDPRKLLEKTEEDPMFRHTSMLAYSADNSKIIMVCANNIKIVNADDFSVVSVLEDIHTSHIMHVAVSPSGDFFLTSGMDNRPRIWKMPA